MQYKKKIFISVGEISCDQIGGLIIKEFIKTNKMKI